MARGLQRVAKDDKEGSYTMVQQRQARIRENPLTDIVACATIGFFGMRRSGKSTAAIALLQKLHDAGVRRFVVFCGNKENMLEWGRAVQPLFVHGRDTEAFERIVAWQDEHVGADRELFEMKQRRLLNDDPDYIPETYKVPPHLVVGVVMDDTGFDQSFMNSKVIKDACSNGRHYGMYMILLMQYYSQLHKQNRNQLEYVMMMKQFSADNIEKIYKEYVTRTCCDLRTFECILAACTDKMGKYLMIDNARGGMSMEKKIFYVKVPPPGRFTLLGSRHFIDFGRRHYLSTRRRKVLMQSMVADDHKVKQDSRDVSDLSRGLGDLLDEHDENDEYDDDAFSDDNGTYSRRYSDTDASSLTARRAGNAHDSVVSLDRQEISPFMRHLGVGHHAFQDKRGNMVQVRLQPHQGTPKRKCD